MPRSIFFDQNGQYLTNLKTMVQKGLDELFPYKIISSEDAKKGFFTVPVSKFSQNTLPNRGGQTNEIAKSRIKTFSKRIEIKTFSTNQDISLVDLKNGTLSDEMVKANLEIGLLKNVIQTGIFGNPELKMDGITTFSERSKVEPAKITNAKEFYDSVKSAIRLARQNGAKLDRAYELFVPVALSDFLMDDFNEFQGQSLEDALRIKLKVAPIQIRGLSNMILFQPDEDVLFVPLFPEIFYRRISLRKGDELQGHMDSTGLLHLNPSEVIEIIPKAKVR